MLTESTFRHVRQLRFALVRGGSVPRALFVLRLRLLDILTEVT
jgi:hypothetical protein